MTPILADGNLADRLRTLTRPTQVVDEAGETLGVFEPLTFAPPGWAKAHSPTTREELERRRQQYRATGEGKSTSEVLSRLEAKGGTRRLWIAASFG